MKQRRFRDVTLQGALEKSLRFLSQYWKNKQFDNTIFFYHFGCTNVIFVLMILQHISGKRQHF